MRILLYNQNPVVEKLVTLSTKKTSDDIINIRSTDELIEESVDLLLVDDDAFIIDDTCYDKIKEKIKFKKSCLIASRDSESRADFDDILYKPFLPTDLVTELERLKESTNSIEEPVEEGVIDNLNLDELNEVDENPAATEHTGEELNLDGLLDDMEDTDSQEPESIKSVVLEDSELDQALADLDAPEEDTKVTDLDSGSNEVNLDTEINLDDALDSAEDELNAFLDSVNNEPEKVDEITDLDSDTEVNLDSNIETQKDDVVETAETPKDDVVETVKTPKDDVVENIETPKDDVVENIETPKDDVVENIETPKDDVVETAETSKDDVVETAETPKDEVVENIETSKDDVVETAETPKDEVVENIETPKDDAVETAETPKDEVVENIETPKDDVVETVETPKDDVETAETSNSEISEIDNLSEHEVGKALGEDIPEPEPKTDEVAIPVPIPVPVPQTEKEEKVTEEPKVEIAKTQEVSGDLNTIMELLKQLDSVGLKKVLNGMELNISIKFKETESE